MDDRFTTITLASEVDDDVFATLAAIGETLGTFRFQSIVVQNGVRNDRGRLANLPFRSTLVRRKKAIAPGALLNTAVEQAHNPIIMFFVAGALPEPFWYVGAAEALARDEVGVVTGRIVDRSGMVVRACGTGVAAGRLQCVFSGLPRDAIYVLRPRAVDMAPLNGLGVRRDRVTAVGGFDAGYAATLFDYDFALRVRRAGLAILYRPDMTIRYDGALPIGEEAYERLSALHFLDIWKSAIGAHLTSHVFQP